VGAAEINWLIEAWRRGALAAFDPAAVAAKAMTLGLHTAAVMIAPKSEAPMTATKKQAKDTYNSRKKSAVTASAALLVPHLGSSKVSGLQGGI
jgi:hypothetical protein